MAWRNPFVVVIREEATLTEVAKKNELPLDDIRLWNQQLLEYTADETLPIGTEIQLPPQLFVRGHCYGAYFNVHNAGEKLRRAQNSPLLSAPLLKPPTRRLVSPVQRLVTAIREEAEKYSDEVGEENAGDPLLVDCRPVQKEIEKIASELSQCELHSFQVKEIITRCSIKRKDNVLHSSTLQTVPDSCRDPVEHGATVVSITVLEPHSITSVQEVWTVVEAQPLTVLTDAIQCKTSLLPYPAMKNSFLFIAGCFYIDDREPDAVDLSEVIRKWRNGAAYGSCPALSQSKTTFGDLHIKFNEMCVFRHNGNCDHYFFFSAVDLLPKQEGQLTRANFPRRTFLAPERAAMCDVCSHLPATIIVYGDRLTPRNPTLFCPACYEVLHTDGEGREKNDGFVKYELPQGTTF